MNKDYLKWFDDNWHMSPGGENGVLFLAEFLALQGYPREWREKVRKAIEYHRIDGKWGTPGEPTLSHDNFTAIVCLSTAYGFDYHKSIFYQPTPSAPITSAMGPFRSTSYRPTAEASSSVPTTQTPNSCSCFNNRARLVT